jgi:putative FmdB family regulatory protein
MPIYEYQCQKCDHEFEREQRITADPIKTCPKCRARRVKKLISQTSFVLKGGGWYNDLYSSSKQDDKSGSSDDAKSEAKSEGKSEGKSGSKKSDRDAVSSGSGSVDTKKTNDKKSSKSAA